jgi:hypothetical protein
MSILFCCALSDDTVISAQNFYSYDLKVRYVVQFWVNSNQCSTSQATAVYGNVFNDSYVHGMISPANQRKSHFSIAEFRCDNVDTLCNLQIGEIQIYSK